MSLTNYTLSCFLLSSICVQVSHMISFSSASVPQPAWKRMNLTNRLAIAVLLLLLVEGPSHRHISVPQRLVSISATFFFSAANVEADAKLQNQAACSGKLTELKSQYDWKLDEHGSFTLPVKQILRVCLDCRVGCIVQYFHSMYAEVWFCPQMLKLGY